jgi:NAD(P)-dependent dehydrogenase (short-subunit alcohol dehydrogenase family)
MSGRLNGKVAVITGSTQGIGAAIARRFVAEGALVALNSHRDDDDARLITKELGAERSIFIKADVAERDAMELLAARAIERFGRIDILINNAGMNVFDDPLTLSDDDWKRCFAVDLEGAWNASRAVLPTMLAQGAGNIVNIASVHGHKIIPGCFPYPVAKHALIGMTRALGLEYAARGIRVNSISPGLIATEAIERHFAACADPDAEHDRQTALLPCKRLGRPEEVAATALFLASDEAPFINATDILIDGGRSQMYHE